MPGWKDDYLSSLMEAERNNPVNFDLVEACTFFVLGSVGTPRPRHTYPP